MPITEKATIKSKCTFSKDRKHKFLLTLEWEEKKPKAVVIMTSPAEANCIVTDLKPCHQKSSLFGLWRVRPCKPWFKVVLQQTNCG